MHGVTEHRGGKGTLEQRVEEGKAAYIESLVFDSERQTLTIRFLRVEPWRVYGTLSFADVCDYQCRFHSEEDRQEIEAGVLKDNLLGISEPAPDAEDKYGIWTTEREIRFRTSAVPSWIKIMDRELYRRWQEATSPFDGITLYSPECITVPKLRRLLIPIVDILQDYASAAETRLWRLEDWHEHDGIVNRAIATTWVDVRALLTSDDALLGACTGDFEVRTTFFDDNRHFLFRLYILAISDNPFQQHDYRHFLRYGIFDLTGDEWLTERVRDAAMFVDADTGLQTMNAKTFFDRSYGG